MDATKIVYSIIAITVGIIVIATVLIPEIQDVSSESTDPAYEYRTLLGVVATLAIISIVMIAVRMMGNAKN